MKSILKATGTGRTATIKLSGGEANRKKKKSFPDKIGAKEVRCSFNREKKKKGQHVQKPEGRKLCN